jgi:Icc-related predicted phosphoesterase
VDKRLRVFVASDFHGDSRVFLEVASKIKDLHASIVIVCGDITHFGSVQEAKALLEPLVKLRLPVLFIPGNCDPPSLTGVDIEGAHCIHGSSEVYGDMTFVGAGGGLISPFSTPFEITEKQLEETLNRGFAQAPERRWIILVSHHPPVNTKLDMVYSGEHIGSFAVRRFIEKNNPSIVFCGHVHEARGTDKIGDTLLVNPGPARHGHYALADFDGKIEVKLSSLY